MEQKKMNKEKIKSIFTRTTTWYFRFQIGISAWVIGMMIIGQMSDSLTCEGGNTWVYKDAMGEGIVLMHIICVILQGILIERVYHGIPKEEGIFVMPRVGLDGIHE